MQKVNTEVGNKIFTTQKRTPRLIPTARPAHNKKKEKKRGPALCFVSSAFGVLSLANFYPADVEAHFPDGLLQNGKF